MINKSVGKFYLVKEVIPPDGEYKGLWGGYIVRITVGDDYIEFNTDNGVRGMNIPVTVVVKDGEATITESSV